MGEDNKAVELMSSLAKDYAAGSKTLQDMKTAKNEFAKTTLQSRDGPRDEPRDDDGSTPAPAKRTRIARKPATGSVPTVSANCAAELLDQPIVEADDCDMSDSTSLDACETETLSVPPLDSCMPPSTLFGY